MAAKKIPLTERFWNKAVTQQNGCMVWTAALDKYGYGVIQDGGKALKAHRTSWELTFGQIPEGMSVLHKCDNPACINPQHLFVGSSQDNSTDMVMKNRQAKGTRQGIAKLTEEQVVELRSLYQSGEHTYRALAEKYQIDTSNVYFITAGITWKHV